MARKIKYQGVGVALVTPFDSKGNVDYPGLERLIDLQINNGTDYLVVQGTTGENVTLSEEEKSEILAFVVKTNAGRLPVVLGVGGNNTTALGKKLEKDDFKGIDAILSVSPYYNKPTQEGIYQHYKYLSERSKLPIILYNVPGRTSSNILPETTLRLAADFKNIIAIKEACGNIEQIMQLIHKKPEGFLVISGDDAITLPLIAAGADGVISVVGNAFPNEFSFMVHQALDGNFGQARTFHYKLFDLIQNLFVDGNPAGVKEVLKIRGICDNNLRLPLVPVREETRKRLQKLITEHKLLPKMAV